MALNFAGFLKEVFGETAKPQAVVGQVAGQALTAAEKAAQAQVDKAIKDAMNIPGAGPFALFKAVSDALKAGNIDARRKDELIVAGLATATGIPPSVIQGALKTYQNNPNANPAQFNASFTQIGDKLSQIGQQAQQALGQAGTAIAGAANAASNAGAAVSQAASNAGNSFLEWLQSIKPTPPTGGGQTSTPPSPPAIGAPALGAHTPSSVAVAAIEQPAVLVPEPVTIAQAAATITGPAPAAATSPSAPAIDVSAMPHGPDSAPFASLPSSPSAEDLAYASAADQYGGLGAHHGSKPPASGASVASVGGNQNFDYGDDREDGGEPPKAEKKPTQQQPARVARATAMSLDF